MALPAHLAPLLRARPNPDPRRITDEHWCFILCCRELEPADTGDLYPYADKPGYHNTRDELHRDGLFNDYSDRLPADRAGPGWATAAFDWISKSAQAGNRAIINRYGGRVRDAYNRRDPRLRGWREVLTQVDAGVPEGFNFDVGGEGGGWYTRTPDNSHDWHDHFSKLRKYLTDWTTYAGMLSILAGEPLADWQAGRSHYLDNPPQRRPVMLMLGRTKDNPFVWVSNGFERRPVNGAKEMNNLLAIGVPWYPWADTDAELFAVLGPDLPDSPPAAPVFTDEQVASLADRVVAAERERGAVTPDVLRAIVDEELDEQSRAGADTDPPAGG